MDDSGVSAGDVGRLTALRGRLEVALEECGSARDLPSLSREYRQLMAELRELHTSEEVDVVDQLAYRRGAKGASGT